MLFTPLGLFLYRTIIPLEINNIPSTTMIKAKIPSSIDAIIGIQRRTILKNADTTRIIASTYPLPIYMTRSVKLLRYTTNIPRSSWTSLWSITIRSLFQLILATGEELLTIILPTSLAVRLL